MRCINKVQQKILVRDKNRNLNKTKSWTSLSIQFLKLVANISLCSARCWHETTSPCSYWWPLPALNMASASKNAHGFNCPIELSCTLRTYYKQQKAQLSPSDRAMRLVSSNLANYHATVQKILIPQVLIKPMVWSWRFSWRQCVINKPTTVELCISPVYRRLAVAKFSKSTM